MPGTPAYLQVTDGLRRLALETPLHSADPLPPEGRLAERFRVSRGTLRRATEELVREGLLSSEPGRGTYVRKQVQVRVQMQAVLAGIARPDSRWHLDVSAFVPDFEGSATCHDLVLGRPEYQRGTTVFVAPDNSLQALVRRMLDDGTTVLVPTYGMHRGIVRLDPARIAPGDREFASTLDGLERFGPALTLDQLAAGGAVGLLVTGAIAFSTSGVHVGTGRAYLDLEWGILAELGLVTGGTPVIGVAHPAQVLDADIVPDPLDINVDLIVTPVGVIAPAARFSRPSGISWAALDPARLDDIAYLADLRERRIHR
jgi:5-formyltetrahydrofolate cyclo-ligase